jgi:hypothetical protein
MRHQFLSGVFVGAVGCLLVAAAVSCAYRSPNDQRDVETTDQQQSIYQRGQPLPLYDYSQDRASYEAIYTARVQGKATYSVAVPDMGGAPWYSCPSRGYPIPADSQLTNPQRLGYSSGSAAVTLPQAEPNGLFSGNGAGGTYMQCVDTDGSLYTVYSEPKVLTFPFAVTWRGDHFEKANPNDRASYTLPTAPANTQAPAALVPTPAATDGSR